MESLVNRYHPPEGVYDEMFDGEEVRSSYGLSYELMSDMPNTEFIDRADYVRSTYLDQGVTFDVGGVESPFPLDVVPRRLGDEPLPQIGVGDRLLRRSLPTIALPAVHPFGDAVAALT